eukprot:9230556-Lingulodinium_polyedra.AAC.1
MSSKKKKAILSMAKAMFAKTFLECVQEGGLLERMVVVGRRMGQQEKESHEYSRIFAVFMEDPSDEEKKKVVEE